MHAFDWNLAKLSTKSLHALHAKKGAAVGAGQVL
jgi:hypothetical protein